jgi:hypothetical protein
MRRSGWSSTVRRLDAHRRVRAPLSSEPQAHRHRRHGLHPPRRRAPSGLVTRARDPGASSPRTNSTSKGSCKPGSSKNPTRSPPTPGSKRSSAWTPRSSDSGA